MGGWVGRWKKEKKKGKIGNVGEQIDGNDGGLKLFGKEGVCV